jgi:hypothetical protein
MKISNYIFFSILFFFSYTTNAQLSTGSIAPDFTLVDINGNTHTLSNYLSQGKKIILNFASVGCGPCWKYHKTEALNDIYKAYGPMGSNEVVILDIYYDSTTIDDLNGISNPPAFGNWLLSTLHPSIISSSINALYQVNYHPLIYIICPSGVIKSRGPSFPIYSLKNHLYNCDNFLTGVENYVEALDTENGFCSPSGTFIAKIKNLGQNFVTTCTLNLKENGIVIGSKTFNGAIPQFSSQEVIFDQVSVIQSATYSYEVTSVNGVSNYIPSFSNADLNFHMSNQTSSSIQIKTHTFICPGNMTWKIKDETGATVLTGGPYTSTSYTNPCGGNNANTIITENFILPYENSCYSLELLASSGYGWKNYQGNAPQPTHAGIEIFSNNTLIFSKMFVENFGNSLEIKNVITTNSLNIFDGSYPQENSSIIYPNPTNGLFSIKTKADFNNYSLVIYTIDGKFISPTYKQLNSKELEINLDGFSTGLYFINLQNKDQNTNELLKVFKI